MAATAAPACSATWLLRDAQAAAARLQLIPAGVDEGVLVQLALDLLEADIAGEEAAGEEAEVAAGGGAQQAQQAEAAAGGGAQQAQQAAEAAAEQRGLAIRHLLLTQLPDALEDVLTAPGAVDQVEHLESAVDAWTRMAQSLELSLRRGGRRRRPASLGACWRRRRLAGTMIDLLQTSQRHLTPPSAGDT